MSKPTLLVPGRMAVGEGARPPAPDEAPADYITAWVRARMPAYGGRGVGAAHRVLAVQAETGSGKSTILPVALFRLLRAKDTPAAQAYRGPEVVCTQPRILTAVTLARGYQRAHIRILI